MRRRLAPTYRPGQRVWLTAKDLPLPVYTCKLAPRYIRPFKVLYRINPVSYCLDLPPSLRVHPTFHVSRLRPVLCSVGSSDRPGPCMVDGALAYMVERLLDFRQLNGLCGRSLPSQLKMVGHCGVEQMCNCIISGADANCNGSMEAGSEDVMKSLTSFSKDFITTNVRATGR
ncbi:hypothetical protein P4O66_001846 [Electrophorus voltai]|uniref:Tf2-1-like SH3-like domain-containing protein n=1 Tax=Electrophorus voltai TaxID=2609070 RepID=A0AAD8Z658_9TELE|nr:hypothetical protein P4O66_001846 [Electrophorus voltai]